MRLLLAERHTNGKSKLLAGSIFLMWGQTVFYAFNGRRQEDLVLRPNDAILWQAIHEACRDGFRYFDLGEVEENHQGLSEFKSKWGTQPKQLYRYYYPAPHKSESGAFETEQVYQLLKIVWRRLPLKATTLVGKWINSYL
jgi:lipid II:glycine glycyltransferase (peptidoglycan interpeptide bridge formation enzyme)